MPELIEKRPKDWPDEYWPKFHAYRRVRHQESRPEDPLTPDDEVEVQMKRDDPFTEGWHLLLFEGDELVGQGGGGFLKEGAPGYESNAHLFWCGGSVMAPHRRKGYGSVLLRRLVEIAEERGKSVVSAGTEEEHGAAFLRHFGFEMKLAGAENRLDLEEVDWKMVDEWVAYGAERNPDTELVFYENRIPEAEWGSFTEKATALLNTMPFDDLDIGDIVYTPEILKDEYERMDLVKTEHHTYITREPDGSISGMTDVQFTPSKPDRILQRFTGVDPAQRGRGLGKWLKASMLGYLRSRYPEARWVITENADSNDAMLGINKKLGFKEYKAGDAYQAKIEALRERLEG